MDIRMNMELKVKLTLEDVKAVYSQNLPMPIDLKGYEAFSLIWLWWSKMESLEDYPFRSTQVPFLHRENPTKNYVFLWISEKSTLS